MHGPWVYLKLSSVVFDHPGINSLTLSIYSLQKSGVITKITNYIVTIF